jgi:hypothetical protein
LEQKDYKADSSIFKKILWHINRKGKS